MVQRSVDTALDTRILPIQVFKHVIDAERGHLSSITHLSKTQRTDNRHLQQHLASQHQRNRVDKWIQTTL